MPRTELKVLKVKVGAGSFQCSANLQQTCAQIGRACIRPLEDGRFSFCSALKFQFQLDDNFRDSEEADA